MQPLHFLVIVDVIDTELPGLPGRFIGTRSKLPAPDAEGALPNAAELGGGEVTSGTFSPTLKQGIALALLDSTVAFGLPALAAARTETSTAAPSGWFEKEKPRQIGRAHV